MKKKGVSTSSKKPAAKAKAPASRKKGKSEDSPDDDDAPKARPQESKKHKPEPSKVCSRKNFFFFFVDKKSISLQNCVDEIMRDVPASWNVRNSLAAMEGFLKSKEKRFPVNEMLLQALKPAEPDDVKIVVFGLAPYPREESACGIALFDAALTSWEDSRLGSCVSMRNIVKESFAVALLLFVTDLLFV
jgi:hypothetical protein